VELELKAEQGCAWGGSEVHLRHLVQPSGDTALCELRLDPAVGMRPMQQRAEVFPERLCPVCRRRCAELLPAGGVRPLGDAVGTDPA
jgi:hypothetical protein